VLFRSNDRQRDEWWKKIVANTDTTFNVNGKVHRVLKPTAYWQIEIEAQEFQKNAYRFPRFLKERPDKRPTECVWQPTKTTNNSD
jgi:hypothetical protein